MKYLIRDNEYEIKPYVCSPNDKFPFYVNITNLCNARCSFCCNGSNKDYRRLDMAFLKEALDIVHDKVSRISISGGETMINTIELKLLLKLLDRYNINMTINTNGSFLLKNVDMLNKYENIEAILLSRHHYDDEKNNEIFGINTLKFDDMKFLQLKPLLRINCLLIKGYIDSLEEVIKYLEKISTETNIFQIGFISMMPVNEFTNCNFVDYKEITSMLRDEFSEIEVMADGDRCSCANYYYRSKCGRELFVYFRYTKEYGCSGRSLFFDCAGLKEGY